MKDKTKILKPILVVTLFASVILACYIRLTAKTSTSEDATVDNSEVGQILAKDMDLNYPKQYRRMQSDYQRSINTKRENRVSGRKERQAWKRLNYRQCRNCH